MKKIALIALMVATAAGVFAQDVKVSAGTGVGYNSFNALVAVDVTGSKTDLTTSANQLLVSAFGDFTYALLNLDLAIGLGKAKTTTKTSSSESTSESDNQNMDLAISAYGKYPINLGAGFDLFPLIGLGYNINVAAKDKDTMSDLEKEAMNFLFFGAGVGCDIAVTPGIYIRPLVLVNWAPGLGQKLWDDLLKSAPSPKSVSSNGILVKAGVNVGFKF